MQKTLYSAAEVAQRIEAGEVMLLAGDAAVLSGLPKGNWIGGTIPYFMTSESGGVIDRENILVTALPDDCSVAKIGLYDAQALPHMAADGAENGFTLLLIPAFSAAHALYAEKASEWPGTFARPIAGWVAGVHLDDLGSAKPQVFDGVTGTVSEDAAVAMHVALPDSKHASIDIVNLFTQGPGDSIYFPASGFSAGMATINGVEQDFATYIRDKGIDTRLPLVADYNSAMINVSLANVGDGKVDFYASVFPDVEYKFATPVEDYGSAFSAEIDSRNVTPVFSCNCILNFLYAGLEGQRTADITGPMTFGEIAYILLNQTLVYLTASDD